MKKIINLLLGIKHQNEHEEVTFNKVFHSNAFYKYQKKTTVSSN
ncbi:Protein of unknown function [Lactobacillus hominis DSM 23910 = CRBIP 24.179]|uniref:Uncharacterized protein n=1 Tax=Lactobacillus hominis DSM 23910 = CRBIP 24.179 TaxID=1423758 RepID=I7L6H8_9LACO|nr:Protein of unknown function [Lactobacillus hominis DSM 23910 = CRBIP 24.179]